MGIFDFLKKQSDNNVEESNRTVDIETIRPDKDEATETPDTDAGNDDSGSFDSE